MSVNVRIVQVATAVTDGVDVHLYGVSDAGKVYWYDFKKDGWLELGTRHLGGAVDGKWMRI